MRRAATRNSIQANKIRSVENRLIYSILVQKIGDLLIRRATANETQVTTNYINYRLVIPNRHIVPRPNQEHFSCLMIRGKILKAQSIDKIICK